MREPYTVVVRFDGDPTGDAHVWLDTCPDEDLDSEYRVAMRRVAHGLTGEFDPKGSPWLGYRVGLRAKVGSRWTLQIVAPDRSALLADGDVLDGKQWVVGTLRLSSAET